MKEGDVVKDTPEKKPYNRYQAVVTLSASELQAVEAWRQTQSIESREEALRRLIQCGLLTEIRDIYEHSRDAGVDIIQRVMDGTDD